MKHTVPPIQCILSSLRMLPICVLTVLAALFTSCVTPATLSQQYPKMYEEKPLTIAIMPPINQTTHAEAKDFFYTTLYMPLAEKGYYVYSPYLTMEMFQQESAYDAELFLNNDLTAFKNVLGADAAMFTLIKEWSRSNLGGRLDVDIEYILRSTKTGETLYHKEGKITVDTRISGSPDLAGFLGDLIATALTTASVDKVVAGRKCNALVLSDMPAGKYSPLYEKDQNNPAGDKIVRARVK